MQEEEKNNSQIEQNDSAKNKNIINSDTNPNDTNNSEIFRHMNQKIKINEEKLKDAKEKTVEIKSELNNDQSKSKDVNPKNNNLMQSTFADIKHHNIYYLKINRCLTARIKKIILIILLFISVCFIFLSIFDIINSFKQISLYKDNKFLMNNFIVFAIQLIYSLSLIIFQGLTIVLEPKDNLAFNLISILFIFFVIVLRIVLIVKNNNNNFTLILNFISSFCLAFINLGIFLVTLKILRMKKNVQQNIEEIINFTDIMQATNSKIGDKKDNTLMLNNSETESKIDNVNETKSNKDGISNLIEETNNNNDTESTSEKK
jgi:hypothetical protein